MKTPMRVFIILAMVSSVLFASPERMRRKFVSLDKDKNGKVSKEEWHKSWTYQIPSESQRNDIWEYCDLNKDGFVEVEEFVTGTDERHTVKKTARGFFKKLDKNKDKKASKEEFDAYFQSSIKSEEERKAYWTVCDNDEDGSLAYEEFLNGTTKYTRLKKSKEKEAKK